MDKLTFKHQDDVYEVVDPDEFENGDEIDSTTVTDDGAPEV